MQPADFWTVGSCHKMPIKEEESLRKAIEARRKSGELISREEEEEIIARFNWYEFEGANFNIYMSAAFRSAAENEVYLFMGREYVLLHYAPGTYHHDFVINGPNLICRGFRALKGSFFGECQITCAFGSRGRNEAFIFYGHNCAKIKYVPGTTDVKIQRSTTIGRMFPFLEGTVFKDYVEAAFELSVADEAYIFCDGKCARINYRCGKGRLIANNVTFNCLKGTIFESGIDAAFASHRACEAYLFKEESFALINYAHDYMIGGVKKILDEWPSLNGIFPRKNCGVFSDDDDDDDDYDDADDDDAVDGDDNDDSDNDENSDQAISSSSASVFSYSL